MDARKGTLDFVNHSSREQLSFNLNKSWKNKSRVQFDHLGRGSLSENLKLRKNPQEHPLGNCERLEKDLLSKQGHVC